MTVRAAQLQDKEEVLTLLDEFREDCIEQVTGKPGESTSARTGGAKVYEALLNRQDYCVLLLTNDASQAVGIITGYLCPILRSGEVRAEVEEFFVKKEFRGNDNGKKLMDAFVEWCVSKKAQKVNLESDNHLHRAHSFYQKYGFKTEAHRFVKKLV